MSESTGRCREVRATLRQRLDAAEREARELRRQVEALEAERRDLRGRLERAEFRLSVLEVGRLYPIFPVPIQPPPIIPHPWQPSPFTVTCH